MTEQDTKNALIEPILGHMGWPKHDLERVRAEYRLTSRDNPVDYALMLNGRAVLFVEAKALDIDIENHKVIAQVLTYATMAGVDWALITNGYRWDLYAAFARVEAGRKRFFSVTLESPDFTEWLGWIQPERLEGNELERHWSQLFAEKRVRQALTALVRDRDEALVSLLVEKTGLGDTDVAAALHALEPTFHLRPTDPTRRPEIPTLSVSVPETSSPPAAVKRKEQRKGKKPTVEKVKSKEREVVVGRGLPKPPVWHRPTQFSVAGETYEVSSWRDLLPIAAKLAHARAPETFEALFDAPEFTGRTRHFLSRTNDKIHTACVVPGGYAEANLSAKRHVALVQLVLERCGFDLNEVSYQAVAVKKTHP